MPFPHVLLISTCTVDTKLLIKDQLLIEGGFFCLCVLTFN